MTTVETEGNSDGTAQQNYDWTKLTATVLVQKHPLATAVDPNVMTRGAFAHDINPSERHMLVFHLVEVY